MATSNMYYRDSGFWVRDFQAEIWLYLLAQEARAVADAPAWLARACDDWEIQATTGFVGCVSSCLDERLGTDSDRVALALHLSERALQRLLAWAPAIPKDLVNSFGTAGDEPFFRDQPTDPLLACGRAFISLLRGELPPGHDSWAC
ncbi:hypothetical protein ACGFYQ_29875 [Streptomyces sp. NPDC048258]|uniref:hypothetical protein n=1 Tax=Streptomyces sp. NPDC048258 TaxID=3365527 RepID=UPI003718F846